MRGVTVLNEIDVNRQSGATEDELTGLEQLIERCEEARTLLTIYLSAAKAVSNELFLDARKFLGTKKDLTRILSEALLEVSEGMKAVPLERVIQEKARHAQLHFQEHLENAFKGAEIQYDGQVPDYTIADIFKLHIDLKRGTSTFDGKRLGTVEPTRIVEQTKQHVSRLLERSFNADEFLLLLKSAYEQEVAAQGKGFGEYADIRASAKNVSEAIRKSGADPNYSDDKFVVDLYRLCVDGRPKTHDGEVLEFSPAQNAEGGIFLAAKSGGGYVAAIRFVRGAQDV
jgi:hypothetical protein